MVKQVPFERHGISRPFYAHSSIPRSERSDTFMDVAVDVASGSLDSALDAFVAEETLEGLYAGAGNIDNSVLESAHVVRILAPWPTGLAVVL